MATYKEIRNWVKQNNYFTIKDCWIGHCKEIYNVPDYTGPSPNRKGDDRKHPCPNSKQKDIYAAFDHFDML